jgi:hypothetical protein
MSGPLRRVVILSSCLLLLVGWLALGTACSSPDEDQQSAVAFIVCQSSQTWTRPSEEEQSREIWHGPFGFRYEVRAVDSLRSALYEDFFSYHGGASEMFDQWPLHGLWTAEDVSAGVPQCERGGLRLSHGQVISVFLLLHQAKEVTLNGSTFYVTVEKVPMGFQEIQFSNLLFSAQVTATPTLTTQCEGGRGSAVYGGKARSADRLQDRDR